MDEVELLDLLLHRYHNIEYILQLDVETGLDLINKALEKNRDDRIFQQWVVQLPYQDPDNPVSFAAYKERVTGANIDRRSVAEIEADVARAEQELKGGGDANGS